MPNVSWTTNKSSSMPLLPWLDEHKVIFPSPDESLTEPNGLLAAGGNLTTETLLDAYSKGIFPWFSQGEPILWWSPDPRLILKPHELHISRSLRKTLRKNVYKVTMDQAFARVMQECAAPRSYTEQTWITPEMLDAYCELHRHGHAHSVECWQQDLLVGGLYGVAMGKAFFGESMFSLANDASKVALVHLCGQLAQQGFELVDCQVESPHLASLGAYNLPRDEFLLQLQPLISDTEATPKPSGWQLNWQYDG
ncbi:leucyl/phenylalanyl-tRNA--protein transferase [Aestuariirhabdus sp. Z084]|uniref:leucyl/phenylalanyl-tRNA--protein transferase n=1 Tax=Aestuariirhabdus haliotis TaxID=2918751 RepID=UPI00201B40DE|nr:leucyl/phenylalanyl-tRNA--protein transferase [Aestuariirhabdus haliotis]MCL6414885.1 leucyl/phenylalanyl-tRNA--protein transferase [Aestuariirhabdus haliotis]MCL6418817.1 leucyl/phenylalanyl-tRNA--protein transferase [Aestuariirhabdus haliotis]